MIRVTLVCHPCRQIIDGTFAAEKVPAVAEWFNEQHLFPKCKEEKEDGGQDEAGAAAGQAEEGAEGRATDGSASQSGKAH